MAINTSEITNIESKLGELAAPAGTLRNYFSGTDLLKLTTYPDATSKVATKIGDTIRDLEETTRRYVENTVSAADVINNIENSL